MPEAVIVSTARTPIGRAFKGGLKDMRPDDLAALAVQAALDKVPGLDPARIDDLMLGCGQPAGAQGHNLARITAILLGMDHLPGTTVNRYCASSLQTTRMAFHAIKAGEGDAFISAGAETVSQYIFGLADTPEGKNARFAEAEERTALAAAGAEEWTDPRSLGLLPDPYIAMGQTAENVARLKGVTRDEMDAFAARSQQLFETSAATGFWSRDVIEVTTPDGVATADDSARPGTTVEGLAGLKPAFRPNGLVTAGNSCPLNDGAAALVIMSDTLAEEIGATPLARIVSTAATSISAEIMGLGPVDAIPLALARAGLSVDDIDLFEINEAFAAQVLPCQTEVGIPLEKLNVNGGAIAVGHPFGMTGARITQTLLHGLQDRGGRYGVESMCAAGGMGMAMVIERLT